MVLQWYSPPLRYREICAQLLAGFSETGRAWSLAHQANGLLHDRRCKSLLVGGYTRLSDSPEVLTAVNTIADLVSNMTIQLMQNGDKGDTRVKNDLSRLVDIKPNSYQTRKSFIFWVVKSMMLTGNAVVMPLTRGGKTIELRPLADNKIRFYYDDKMILIM